MATGAQEMCGKKYRRIFLGRAVNLCESFVATLGSTFTFHGSKAGQFIPSESEGSHTCTLRI